MAFLRHMRPKLLLSITSLYTHLIVSYIVTLKATFRPKQTLQQSAQGCVAVREDTTGRISLFWFMNSTRFPTLGLRATSNQRLSPLVKKFAVYFSSSWYCLLTPNTTSEKVVNGRNKNIVDQPLKLPQGYVTAA